MAETFAKEFIDELEWQIFMAKLNYIITMKRKSGYTFSAIKDDIADWILKYNPEKITEGN